MHAAQVGPDQVDESAYYLLICPQNVVGNTIMDHLHGMVRPRPLAVRWLRCVWCDVHDLAWPPACAAPGRHDALSARDGMGQLRTRYAASL